jgi:mono/diheme cytochrome c family protein
VKRLVFLAISLLCVAAPAQQPPARDPGPAPSFPDAPGKEVLLAKCFQCHGPNMWIYHRQDRRSWESTLYRMVGRGALWTEDEIRAMADYLGAAYARSPK